MEQQTSNHADPQASTKQRFAHFLRAYHRSRYEPLVGASETHYDQTSTDGTLKTDGLLRFRKMNGEAFVATFNCITKDNKRAILFQANPYHRFWDATAAAAAMTATTTALVARSYPHGLHQVGSAGIAGIQLALFLLTLTTVLLTLQSLRKYRQIPLLEQYKSYRADEQWIVLAAGLLNPATDAMMELRKQIAQHGSGLAEINEKGGIRVIAAASRLDNHRDKRKIAHWISQAAWQQVFATPMPSLRQFHPGTPVLKKFKFLPALWLNRNYLTLPPPAAQFLTQKVVTAAAILVSLLLGPFSPPLTPRETSDFIPSPIDIKTAGPELQGSIMPNDTLIPDLPTAPPDYIETDISDNSGTNMPLPPAEKIKSPPDPCSALKGKAGWLIQTAVFQDAERCKLRLTLLQESGFVSGMLPMNCLNPEKTGYLIWIDRIFTDFQAAEAQIENIEKELKIVGLFDSPLQVRKL